MSNDKREFEGRCKAIRNAKAAVDVFQRTSEKGPFENVTIHVHSDDDEGCIAVFNVPVGAINEFLSSATEAVGLAESIATVLEQVAEAAKGTGPTLEA